MNRNNRRTTKRAAIEPLFNSRKLLKLIDNSTVEYNYNDDIYWLGYRFIEENYVRSWAKRTTKYSNPWASRRRHEAIRIKVTIGRHIICLMQHLPLHTAAQ